jgi:hypothetical protein
MSGKNNQPVRLEIENNSNSGYYLYLIAMDPNIFWSGEVFIRSLFKRLSKIFIIGS